MRGRVLVLIAAVALATLCVAVVAEAAGPRVRAKQARLKNFKSCAGLVAYGQRHAGRELRTGGPVIPPGGVPEDAVAPPAQGSPGTAPEPQTLSDTRDSSRTNVQERGVDEPDIVETDGQTIFAVAGGRLHAIDARAQTPRLLGSLVLETGAGELLRYRDRLLILSYQWQAIPVAEGAQAAPDVLYPGRPATVITEVDVGDPAAMRVLRTETVEGSYVSARRTGATVRIVLTSPSEVIEYDQTALRSRARGWLPQATLENARTGNTRTRRISSCRSVRRPRLFSGLDTLTVLTVDMERGLPAVDADALMADGQTVYASKTGLYVATQRFLPPPDQPDQQPPELRTAIHSFDISEAGATRYRSSGEVTGYVLNQFALSEHEGVLRVATTDSPAWWGGAQVPESQSYVTTLRDTGDLLLPVGRVGGLGLGERIQGVRFAGPVGYVVTFRQTDPLYTIDLSQPNAPRVAGELKILGWSAYLHPIDDGLLIGVGQDATEEGARLGSQVSLFDVSDIAQPTRLAQFRVGDGGSSSDVEYDHHAFLWWAPQNLAVLPVSIYGGDTFFSGAIGLRVTRDGIAEVGRISHDGQSYPASVRRALVVGDRIFTVSELGAKSNTLSSFAEQAWVPFPEPEYPQYPVEPQPAPAR